jgi:hypothetical protein
MRPLSSSDILRIWDLGQDHHPVDRALRLLWLASPEASWEELAALPVGRRDALLGALRASTFGGTMNARAACPACATAVELTLEAADLRVEPPARVVDTLEVDGIALRFRLPNTLDLAAVARLGAQSGEPRAALSLLLARCVLEARRGEAVIAPEDLPESILTRLSEAMAEQDPQAEVLLDLVCPACRHPWQALLDIVDFVWREVSAGAARVLGEVHTLARAYHWREGDILAMSSRRRQAYLEMATA